MFNLKRLILKFVYNKKNAMPIFGRQPNNFKIENPYKIKEANRIYLGDNISLGPNCVLMPIMKYPSKLMKNKDYNYGIQKFDPYIILEDSISATSGLQIYALKKIHIESHVMFGANVFICDCFHGYDTADIPYKYQPINIIDSIIIRSGCWIGQNVVITPNVEIGSNSIVGANSVVTRNIPEKVIAVGSPARIIKKWNDVKKIWEKVI